MEKFTYYSPTKIIFGKDTQKMVAQNIKEFGGSRVLVVYGGSSAEKTGLLNEVRQNLDTFGIAYAEIGGVVPNPLLSKVREGIEIALGFKADFVLAVGGGSVIDSAKAIALGAANPGIDVWQYWTGKEKATKALPVGTILTIPAAGSETSMGSVISNDEEPAKFKRVLNSDVIRGKFAILNPLLTFSLPPKQIAAGVVDIFMHTAERYFANILGNHLTDEIAEGVFRIITEFGPKGLANPNDYHAMSEIMWCGSVSHLGLTGLGNQGDTAIAGDWACHGMSLELSSRFDATHGMALSALWGTWAKYVYCVNPERFARMAEKVYGVTEGTVEEKAQKAIGKTVEFFSSMGAPTSIEQLIGHQLDDETIRCMADNCSRNKTISIGGFKRLGYDDIYQIFLSANSAK